MKAKERDEIIVVLTKAIKYLEEHLEDSVYLCYLHKYLASTYEGRVLKCGFNDRMLPQAIQYINHQHPTAQKNKNIYNKPCYNKESISVMNVCWWHYFNHPSMMINMEKIDFLKHLINKLKS